MRKTVSLVFALVFTLSLMLTACSPTPVAPTETVTLKLAMLPIIDALPVYVAQQEGLFAKRNLNIEVTPVASAPERDQLISAGQADGMINETLSTFFFNREKIQVQIVRYALTPTENAGHFFILASAKSGITTPEQLKGVEIGVSQGTIIEYVTYRLLEKAGLKTEEIKTIAVPKMPDRMALLASGDLQAAVMPDPLAALSVSQGAKVVLDDSGSPEFGFSVYTFRKETIDQEPEAIRAFLAAIDEAIALINAEPQKFNGILSEQKLVPQPLLETYKAPPYPAADVPSGIEWKDALDWAKSKDLIAVDVSFEDSVNPNFLPK
jgi:NitT/TauT family transport system substrate-binding protein